MTNNSSNNNEPKVYGTNYTQEQFDRLPLIDRISIAGKFAIVGGAKPALPGQKTVWGSSFTQQEFNKTPLPFQILAKAGYSAAALNKWIAPNPRKLGQTIGNNLSQIFFPSPKNIMSQDKEMEAIKKARLKQPQEVDNNNTLKGMFPVESLISLADDMSREGWKSDDLPDITVFPNKIYAHNPIRASKTYQGARPTLPQRKLTRLINNIYGTKTPPRRTATLKSSAANRLYGLMVHRPISKNPAIMYQSEKSKFFNTLPAQQKRAAKKYSDWAANNNEQYPKNFTLYDTSVILMTGVDAERTEMYFGMDFITGLAQEYKRQSFGALAGVRCKVPTKITSKEPTADPPYTKEDIKGLRIDLGNDNDMLIKAIARTVGVGDLPDSVPEWLIAGTNKDIKVNSVPQLLGYVVRQLDALIGQFPIEMVIKDADPTTPGDQTKKINLPNISEALAEMMGMQINALINTETLINTCIRTLTEVGSVKVSSVVTQDYVKGNAEYLGWKQQAVSRDIPYVFTPGKTKMEEILKESTQKIKSVDNQDKSDIMDYLKQLLFAAAIIRAVFYRKVDPNKDIKEQIKEYMKKYSEMLDPKKEATDWDNFVRDAENGYMNTTGNQDPTHPYGREYDERPKIKNLGDTSK